MRRLAYWAALVAIGTLALAGCNREEKANSPSTQPAGQQMANAIQNEADQTGQAMNQAATRAGEMASGASTRASALAEEAAARMSPATNPSNLMAAPDAEDIRSALAATINDALSPGGFNNFVGDFTDSGRKQLSDASKLDVPTHIDPMINQIRSDWKAKYGSDFHVRSQDLANTQFIVTEGTGALANPGGATNAKSNTATVMVQPSSSFAGVLIPLRKEGLLGSWKIDPPSSLNGQRLSDNLSKELTAIRDSKENWPADESAAYRVVTERILAAGMDKAAAK